MKKISQMTPVFIDFETYLDKAKRYSLTHLSDLQYITDPRFQVLSVAIGVNGKTRVYPGNTPLWKKQLLVLNDDDHIFVAHNGRFDFRILSIHCGIVPRWMADTMLMARFMGYPKCGLGELAHKLLSDQKLELNVDGKRLKDLSQDEWKNLVNYNEKDIRLTQKLYQILLPNLPQMEMPLIDQTLKLCLKSHSIDWGRVEKFIVELDQNLISLRDKNMELFENRNRPAWIRNHIHQLTGIDPKTTDKKKVVIEELVPRAQEIFHTVWEFKEIEREKDALATLRRRMTTGTNTAAFIDLNYSKAVTHRWSSGGEDTQSFNMQNMGRKSGTRNIWIPDSGNAYVIVDLSQIEARVAAWYAGERALLQAFAANQCVYCEFGRHVFGHVLSKETEKSERQLCKQAVLGLQFGMGVERFHQTLLTQVPDHLKQTTIRLKISSENLDTGSSKTIKDGSKSDQNTAKPVQSPQSLPQEQAPYKVGPRPG